MICSCGNSDTRFVCGTLIIGIVEADIYKGVINDVISQVKEAFLDENVDVDVLQQLKKEWEEKLMASGSVDLEGTKPVAPPPIRQVKPTATAATTHVMATPQAIPAGSTVRIAQGGQHILVQQTGPPQMGQPAMVMQATTAQPIQRPVQQVQYISASTLPITTDPNALPQVVQVQQRQQLGQGTSQTISAIPSGMIAFQPGQGARIIQQGGQQYLMHSGPANLPPGSSVMIVNANGQQIPVTLGSATMIQPGRIPPSQVNPKIEGGVPQVDGAGVLSLPSQQDDDQPGSSKVVEMTATLKSIKLASDRKGKRDHLLLQLDGAGRISDSSSDEEDVDEDDDDDPLRRIADRIGEDGTTADDDEQVVEEDPLNSGDDQSDDEDVERLFEADNVVMCQFEKVSP
ncbi:unnamed protein product [Toxocara canis]|uniref:Transcription initiation factor IIA subunit 1 n=1 Tax=Toxocara canis TaxID=6265 RepID=A0A183ULC3_TOXCA|nr:unnamed protein product [Toxocara canis]